MKKQYFKLSIPILIFISCNETQIKNNKNEELEKEIRNLESKKTLSRNDSLTIYKKINEEKKYQKVINMLDSLKKADNTMYNILLDESSNRYFDLNIDNQTDILSNEL